MIFEIFWLIFQNFPKHFSKFYEMNFKILRNNFGNFPKLKKKKFKIILESFFLKFPEIFLEVFQNFPNKFLVYKKNPEAVSPRLGVYTLWKKKFKYSIQKIPWCKKCPDLLVTNYFASSNSPWTYPKRKVD